MKKYRFHYPITVRYGDLDPQWHVNNARFLIFSEQARIAYLKELGLFNGTNFFELPLIVADVHCRYLVPIEPGVTINVYTGVDSIGNKSLMIGARILSEDGSVTHAEIETVLVAYDYRNKKTVPVSDEMRKVFTAYEGKEFA